MLSPRPHVRAWCRDVKISKDLLYHKSVHMYVGDVAGRILRDGASALPPRIMYRSGRGAPCTLQCSALPPRRWGGLARQTRWRRVSLASLACASPPDGEHHAITRRPAAVQNWRAGRPAGVEELPTTHIYPQASLPPPEARLVPFGALVERKRWVC